MPAPKTDFELIFEALSGGGVEYVVVGGVAVVLHGHPRLTADLDLVVALEPANARRAMQTLASLGYRPHAPVNAEDLADPSIRQRWIEEKGLVVLSLWSDQFPVTEIDVFVSEPLPFGQLLARASRVSLAGVIVRVAGIGDLIAMKERTGRPKDLQDVAELKKLRAVKA